MTVELCGDFKNNKCTRGRYCRFYHPKLLICKDFQNVGCEREKCRFLHVTRVEEETYDKGGGLPNHITEHEARTKILKTPPNWRNENTNHNMNRKRKRDDISEQSSYSYIQENRSLKKRTQELEKEVDKLKQVHQSLSAENQALQHKVNLSLNDRYGSYSTPQTTNIDTNPVICNINEEYLEHRSEYLVDYSSAGA